MLFSSAVSGLDRLAALGRDRPCLVANVGRLKTNGRMASCWQFPLVHRKIGGNTGPECSSFGN
jgi:hypothetical protein